MRLLRLLPPVLCLGLLLAPAPSSAGANRVLDAAEKMKAFFQGVEDYASEVQQTYFKDGVEETRYRFKYAFKKPDRIRVDFIYPHEGLTVYYRRGEEKATVRPFPSLPFLKFRLFTDNSLIQTPTGQSINQTDMVFFIDFLFRNLAGVPQKDSEFRQEGEQVVFYLWGRDYVKGELPEKYRISLSTRSWFPVRIERYSPEGKPVEISLIGNYVFNSRPGDRFFLP